MKTDVAAYKNSIQTSHSPDFDSNVDEFHNIKVGYFRIARLEWREKVTPMLN